MDTPKKVVLAYSGGLDTSIILKWLKVEMGAEVVTFTADLGQGEEVEPARKKAEAAGVKEIFIDDLREEFVRDFVFPMFRANAVYEGVYLLGTSIARPLISKRLVEIARETGADAVAHGATGKGNDQVRFDVGIMALNPNLKVLAPAREWGMVNLNFFFDNFLDNLHIFDDSLHWDFYDLFDIYWSLNDLFHIHWFFDNLLNWNFNISVNFLLNNFFHWYFHNFLNFHFNWNFYSFSHSN